MIFHRTLNGLPITRHSSTTTTLSTTITEVVVESTLTMATLDRDDLGDLMCMATNVVGTDNETTHFNVMCKFHFHFCFHYYYCV